LEAPQVHYTQTADGVSIAYAVFGNGPLDLLCILGFVSHLEVLFEAPGAERYFGRLGSFCRVVMYDKRGQGLSDRPPPPPTLEQSMEDARAVLDSAGRKRVAVFAISEGGPTSALLANGASTNFPQSSYAAGMWEYISTTSVGSYSGA
jgi:pimeloyl-ACP methyl ester carboxylesterase